MVTSVTVQNRSHIMHKILHFSNSVCPLETSITVPVGAFVGVGASLLSVCVAFTMDTKHQIEKVIFIFFARTLSIDVLLQCIKLPCHSYKWFNCN